MYIIHTDKLIEIKRKNNKQINNLIDFENMLLFNYYFSENIQNKCWLK